MTRFDKLVRDKIPEMIRSNGDEPQWHVIEDDQDYLRALLDKDEEESAELRENPSLEELADSLKFCMR